jgi:hypothetical protein
MRQNRVILPPPTGIVLWKCSKEVWDLGLEKNSIKHNNNNTRNNNLRLIQKTWWNIK